MRPQILDGRLPPLLYQRNAEITHRYKQTRDRVDKPGGAAQDRHELVSHIARYRSGPITRRRIRGRHPDSRHTQSAASEVTEQAPIIVDRNKDFRSQILRVDKRRGPPHQSRPSRFLRRRKPKTTLHMK